MLETSCCNYNVIHIAVIKILQLNSFCDGETWVNILYSVVADLQFKLYHCLVAKVGLADKSPKFMLTNTSLLYLLNRWYFQQQPLFWWNLLNETVLNWVFFKKCGDNPQVHLWLLYLLLKLGVTRRDTRWESIQRDMQ